MNDFRLNSVWKTKREKDSYICFHSHNFYELVYYTYGSGKTTIGDKEYSFSKNTFTVIPPEVMHDEIHSSESEVFCLGFKGAEKLSNIFYTDTSSEIYKILNVILKESVNQPFGYEKMIRAKLAELYIQIERSEKQRTSAAKSFEYIINYIRENYHEKIKLSECADKLNISYDYFQHKFKELTGLSPQNFLLEYRLQGAREMLSSELSCTEIAYRCGFSTSAQFSMLFKNKYGVSPKRYRMKK